MRKIISMVLTIITVMCCCSSVFAAELTDDCMQNNIEQEESNSNFANMEQENIRMEKMMQEYEAELNDNQESIGGYYYEGNELHVIPMEGVNSEIFTSCYAYYGDVETKIIFDEPVKYSMQDLNEAYDCLLENWDDLEITGFLIDVFNNRINVYAEEWNETDKEIIRELIDVDNIHFGIDGGVVREENNKDELLCYESDYLSDANHKARLGFQIYDADSSTSVGSYIRATIGGCVKISDNKYGVITTAHNLKRGDSIYVNALYNGSWQNGFLGYVDDLKLGGNLDVALITIENNSSFSPTALTSEDDLVDSATAGTLGREFDILGSESKGVKVKMYANKASFIWNDPDSGEANIKYKNMYEMQYIDGKQTVSGDSGAPILRYWKNGDMSLAGIYKGRKIIDGERMAIGSSYERVEDYFGVYMYQDR